MEEQELKIQLNQKIQMLEVTRNELNEERENNAKYKHFIKTKIIICSQIFSSVINNLNDCIETTESDISIPNGYDGDHYSSNEEREQAGPSTRVNPKTSKSKNNGSKNKFFSSVINNLNDCIVTTDLDISIPDGYDPDKYLSNEEREQAGPSTRVNPKTSKINELNKLCKNNAKERNESVRQSLRISTPNKSTFPAFQDFQNITSIPAQTSSPPINLQDTNNSSCSNNSSTASSFNINQDTPRKSHKRDSLGRRLSNSEDETLPKKKLSIDISAVSLTENQLQEYLDKFDSNDIYEDDNESLFSSPSTSSSKVSIATTRDSVATSKDSAATKKRKPRAKAEPVKRKSNGRPKRKIALNVSLAEKSCRTKLRRSK
ncbi:unnamed protein product [Diamesa tonsa]